MTRLDYMIVLAYLAASLGLGIAFRGRNESAQDYFTAHGQMRGRIGNILVGLSIAATLFSGISFVATPAFAYQYGPAVMLQALSFPICWALLRFWFLPRYFAHGGSTPFQIIADHVGSRARVVASVMFILLRLSWISAMLYAPTLIFLAAGRLSANYFWPTVFIIGAVCTSYTVMGGIRSVVITDALQFAVIALGLIAVVAVEVSGLSWPQITSAFTSSSGFYIPPAAGSIFTDVTSAWALIIGGTVANLGSYVADQMSLQRYLASGNVRDANRSFACNAIGISAVALILGTTGVLLHAWYVAHPDANLPRIGDQILPYFISRCLPTGMTGLLLAAILAATMSSMTSGINALAGCITNDFVAPKTHCRDARHLLRIGRIWSLAVGITGTAGVVLVIHLGAMWQICMTLFGIFLGPLLGLMATAASPTRWLRENAAIAGVIGGFLVGVGTTLSSASPYWTPPAAFISTLVIAHGLSLSARAQSRQAPVRSRS